MVHRKYFLFNIRSVIAVIAARIEHQCNRDERLLGPFAVEKL